ncbi:PF20097 family protein [Bradyrhizobium sp.]|uniref:PF20097 family protein n=1 Tax=Bradyrhizobium sp. TaxID=376 RepID=UPI00352C3B8C
MTDQKACPKCASTMEQGFIPSPGRGQLLWFAGVPPATYRESFMFGRKAVTVTTYRCSACGYLESYTEG